MQLDDSRGTVGCLRRAVAKHDACCSQAPDSRGWRAREVTAIGIGANRRTCASTSTCRDRSTSQTGDIGSGPVARGCAGAFVVLGLLGTVVMSVVAFFRYWYITIPVLLVIACLFWLAARGQRRRTRETEEARKAEARAQMEE